MTRKKDNKQTLPGKRRSAMVFEELEPRLLLSADLPIDLPAVLAPDRGEDEPVAVHEEITTTAVTGEQHTALELVFVDTGAPDYQLLVDDLLSNSSEDRPIEVVLLDNRSDGIAQITDMLSQYHDLDAVHIISHGSEGSIDLGGTQLEFDTLLANTKAIQGWAEAFSDNGDLLIYGCNLAASADGQALVDSLARLTGADVAASDDLTGDSSLGGDWQLEYQTGQVEAAVIGDEVLLRDWTGTLEAEQASAEFLSTPLAFEENTGQTDEVVDFLARGDGYSVFLTDGDAVLMLDGDESQHVVRLDLVGANTDLNVIGQNQLASSSNYLIGNDESNWQTNVDNFASVYYENVYQGIDLRYYGNQRQLEYDFVVGPGSDPDEIRLSFDGVLNAEITESGELRLVLNEQGDETFFKAPISYQTADDGSRIEVESAYVIYNDGSIGFTLGEYDSSRELVIDPILDYLTFIGGTGYEVGQAIAVDDSGNVYITGQTASTDFPTTVGALNETHAADGGSYDIYVAKLSVDGSSLLYSTFIGGDGSDQGYDIKVDGSGNAYIAGITSSSNLATVNAYQSALSGTGDAFLLKLNSTGDTLLYSSYFGGGGSDTAAQVELDSSGMVYVAGNTQSADLPLKNALDSTLGGTQDAFVARFDLTQTGSNSLLYSTYFGGSGSDSATGLDVDSAGNFYISGTTDSNDLTTVNAYDSTFNGVDDIFLTKFNSTGGALLYSSYLGGADSEFGDGLAVDDSGNAYLSGRARTGFTTTAGAYDTSHGGGTYDTVVAKFDTTLTGVSSLSYSTYLGGGGWDMAYGLDIDADGNVYVTGATSSLNYPTTADGNDRIRGGSFDGYLTVLDASGANLVYSTYLGGGVNNRGYDVTLDSDGTAYVTGFSESNETWGTTAPTTLGPRGGTDAFVAKFTFNQPPTATGNNYTVAEGGTLNGNVITDNTGAGVDSDPEGDPLTASVVDGPLHGNIVLNADGSFTYTPFDEPASNFADSDSFTYQLSDGKGGTDTATVTITVTPDATNEAPVNSMPGAQSVDQDSALVFSEANGNRILLRDDAGGNTIELTLTATNGTITLAGTTGLAITGGADGTASVTVQGSLTNLNNALDGLIFAPTAAYFGSASLQVTTNDLSQTGSGVPESDTDTISITVNEVNYVPVITSNGGGATASISVAENTISVTTVTASDANPGDTLSYSISGADAALFDINSATGVLTFKDLPDFESPADADLNNDYQVTVTVLDGNGGTDNQDVTVTVTQVTDSGSAVWSNTSTTPQTSDWNGSSFGSSSGTVSLPDNYRTIQGADAPTRDEKIVVGIDATGNVSGEMWDGTSWGALPLSMGTVSETYWYGAEVAYEQLSGDAIIVWNDNSQAAGDMLRYAVWDGTSWSTPQSIGVYSGAEPQTMRLAFDPGSDAMVLIVDDINADDYALVWDGDSWGNAITLDTTGTLESDQSAIAVSFEAQSGKAVVTYGIEGSSAVYYRIWDGSSWSAQSSVAAAAGITGDASWLVTATDYSSDRIALATMTSAGEIWLSVWDGAAWDTPVLAETGSTGTVYPNLAVAFESSTGEALATYGQSGQSDFRYRTWDSVGGWSTEQVGPGIGAVPNSMTLDSGPTSDHVMLSIQDGNNDLHYLRWDGSGWSTVNTLTTNTGEVKNQPFVFIYDQDGMLVEPNSSPVNTVPATQNTAIDTAVVFSTANGNVISVTDADDGSVEISLSATDGTLTLSGTTGLTFSTGDGSADASMTFSGTLNDINAALDGLQFDPTAAFEGFASVQISTTDFGGSGAGSPKSDVDTVTVEVGDINTAPVNTVPAEQTIDQDGMLLFSSATGTAISIADADAGGATVQVTLTATNGTLSLPGIQGLSFSTGDGSADSTMTFTGTIADINAALEGMYFLATPGYAGAASVLITTDDLGNTGAGGALSDTDTLTIAVGPVHKSLWLSTIGSATDGATSWNAGDLVDFGDPGLAFEPGTTAGTFSATGFSLDAFAGRATDTTAIHVVGSDISVGSNAVQLYADDLLLASKASETLTNSDSSTTAVATKDVFVFRPDTPGDYSSGTFFVLITGADIGLGNVTGVTLVEQATVVGVGAGSTTLQAGDFLLAHDGSTKKIELFEAGTLGTGTSGTRTVLVDGADIDIGANIHGVELIETSTAIGGVTLQAGQILVSLAGDDNAVGDNTISTTRQDVFLLDITQTGATTVGDATLFLQGNDTGLDAGNNAESVNALSLMPNLAPQFGDATLNINENSANGTSVGTVSGSDPDGDPLNYLILGGNAGGAFAIDASTGEITVANSGALDFETTPIFTLTLAAIDDSGAYTSATVTINLNNVDEAGVNDAPFNTVPGAQTIDTDGMLLFSSATGKVLSVNDFDAGSNPVQVTLTATNGTLNLASTNGLSFSVGDGTSDATMTFTGTIADINAALEGATFVATAGFTGMANVQIITDDLGNTGTGGAQSDTDSVSITVSPSYQSLLLTTTGSATSDASSGSVSWNAGDLVELGDPGLTLEPVNGTTSGTFSSSPLFSLDAFAGRATNLNGIHYVTGDIAVGSNSLQLQADDILFVTDASETLTNSDLSTLAVTTKDIVAFRPTTPGDYSAGDFFIVVRGADIGLNNITAFSLVEQDTVVGVGAGSTTLNAGEFIVVHDGAKKTLQQLTPGILGGAATNTGTTSLLVDGAVINIGQDIYGLELIESDTSIGGVDLQAGQILVTLKGEDSTVGDNNISTVRRDIFLLDITQTGATTVGDATLLFEGNDVGLDAGNNNEDVWGISMAPNQAPTINNDTQAVDENSPNGTLVTTVTATDPENAALTYAITAGNTSGAFAINATTGQITVANSAALDFETTPTFTLTIAAIDDKGAYDAGTLTINLNDLAATITAGQSFSLAEDAANSDPVGIVATTGDPAVSFSITAGNTDGVFAIDNSGNLTVANAAALDFETTPSYTLTIETSDGTTTVSETVTVSITNVNEAPVLTDGSAVSYSEGNGTSPFLATGTLTDADSADFDGGSLTYSITSGGDGTDTLRLGILNGVTVSSNNVYVDGVLVGTQSGGTGGTPYTIGFTSNATPTRVETLFQTLIIVSAGDNPTIGVRNLEVVITDGDGGTSNIASATADMTNPVNDDPFNAGTLPSDVTVTEDVATNIDLSAIDFADPDANGGVLTVTLSTSTGGQLALSAGTGITLGGTPTATTVTGTLADLNVYFDNASNISYLHSTANFNGDNADSLTISIVDNGNTGAGGGGSINLGSVNIDISAVTDLTATDDALSTNEDTALNADVSTNDSTTSGGALTYAVATGASNGSVSMNADGTFTYTPTANYTGSDSFTYTVTDAGSGESDTRTVNLTVDPVTDLMATDDAFSTNEDTVLNADVSTNDSTTSGGALSYTLATGASNGSVTLNGNGTFTYTPTTNFNGADSFTYTVTDAVSGESDTRSVSLTVDPVTDLSATDDAFSTNEDTVLNADVSTNDSTTSGGALSYAVATGASDGSVSMNADGTFTYTPTTNFNGADSFTYTVTDASSGESSTQTVTITVDPVADLSATDDAFSTNEDTALNADVSTNDSTTSGGTLTYAVATGASNGSVSMNADGTFTYTPAANYTGSDSFTYTVTDASSGESDTRTVNLTVDPVTDLTATDDAFSTNEDTVLNADVSTNDSTTSGGALSYTLATGASNGSVTLNGNGTFTYTPTTNFNGADSFTYTVTDAVSGESDTRTVSLTVDPVTDLSATDDAFSGNEDTVLNADVSTNDGTTSGGALSYAVATGASDGSVSMNADGAFTYTPTTNFNGADSFTYTVTDAASGESDTRAVNLTVDPVIDLTATDDAFSTNEDTVLNADVSTNDSTTSGGALSYTLATGAANGSVVVNNDGTFTYTPGANYVGADSFTYTVTDAASGESDTRTVSLTVNPVADLSATDDSFSTNEDTVLNADVSTNDSTTSGGALSYALATGTSNGSVTLNGDGTFTYTPTSNYTGADSFTYTVTDAASGESDTRTVSLTVDPVTDLTATDDAFSTNEDTVLNADVSTNDSTTSGGALSYALATGASNGSVTLNGDGTFTYTPGSNYTGADSFSYTVTDAASGESDTRTVSLTVDPIADLSATDDAFSTNEDTILNADVSTNDSTTSGGALSYALAAGATNGSVVVNSDGTFTYTPGANYTGADSFTYTVTDAASGESDTRTVSLTVDPVTDLTATDDAFSTNEDTVLNADVSTNDSTTSGGALSYALAAGATNGSVVVNNDGTFTCTPGANYTGADSFTYTVTDASSGESDNRTVNLTINPVTDLTATDDAFSTNEDTVLNADVSTNDSTTSGGTLSYAVATGASNGSVSMNADGTFTYTPTSNYTGSDSFTYTVTDAASGESSTQTVTITVDAVSDLTATDDAFSTNEDTVLNADVSTNDSTTSGGALSYALATGASNGSVSMNADGTFTYTPTTNFNGADSFSYTVTDAASGESDTRTVSLTVNPASDLTATDDSFSTNEDTALNADVSTNDSTTSGGGLSYALATGASNGSVVVNNDGTFTYTPNSNYTGADSFSYTVTDADSGESSTQTVTITVDPVTDLTATDDSFSTNEDTALNADVSTNDSTTSGGTLSYAVATGASNGSVSMNADGTFTYTPTSNYTGSDSFTYTVTDAASGESSTQTVTITVDAVSDLTATDDAFSTNEDTVLNADVSTNDSTTSGGALSYALATGASNGSVSMNADGTFTYTPTTNFNGADSFSYTVTDAASGESDTRTVSLTVNPASDLTATDDSFSTNEDTALNADVSTNDSTTSGGGLSYALATGASNGSVVVNNDGTFTYTPNSNYTGADSFSYTVTDAAGGESDTRSVSLTVDPVTDLSATDDAFSTNEDTVLNADVSTNDSTTSGGALSYTLATGAANGSVVVNNDGTFTYTPGANYVGADSFTYTVTDAASGESDTRTVSLTVNPVADLSATDDSFSTNEDTALNADVSTNDSTTSGGALSYALATGTSNGSVTLNGDGTFTYTPTSNYTGADSFTYTVTDAASGESDTRTVSLTVDPVTDLTATDDAFSTNEDTVLNADVSTNDSTTSGGALSYALATGASNGSVVVNNDGTFTYTPTANYTGSDSFTYTVTDAASGESDTRTVSLTVDPVTDLTATDDSFSTNEDTALNADVSTNDSTTSGGALSYALATGATNGSVVVNNDGTFTYTPGANYTGVDSFSYTVTDADSGESSTQTVTITVDPVTDLTATDDSFSTNEDTALNADVSTNDSTTSGGALSYALATGASNGSVVVNNDGTFTYTPTANYTGSDSFTYTVTDAASGESDTRTVSLTVDPVTDLTATDDSFSTNEDTALNADVSTNDSTTSGGALSYALATGATNGSVVVNNDGTFTYTPGANYTGVDSFSYTVTDADSGESSTQTVTITVDPVTDLTATDDSFSTNEDTALNADVSTNDSTTSGGALSYTLATGAANGSVVVNNDGTFTYTPGANYVGADSFTYTVTDAASGESDTRTVSLTVDPVTDLTATDDAFSTNEDTILNADVSTNDSTTSGGALSYALAAGATNGSVVVNNDGTFTYTPGANYTGADSFTYTVTDAASGESDTRTVSLTVDPVTDLTATDDAFSTNEDTVLNADVSTNDSTTSGGALSYALAAGATNGSVVVNNDGTFTYTPGANYTGADSFTYTVTDASSGESDNRTVNLTINPVTDLTATDDAFSTNEDTVLNADVSTNDSTTSGGALSYALATGASNGSVSMNADGTFTYTPTTNFNGADSFSYTVTDAASGESDTRTVSLTVNPASDLTATDDSFSTNEDTALNADVSTNDSTTSGGGLSYALATGASNGSVVVNNDGTFTYTPNSNYTGADSFSYTVTDADSGESSTQTVTITVDPVTDLIATDDAFSTNEDTVLNADVSTNDSTTSGGALSYALATGASNGTLALNADGTFTYTPGANYTGADSFTYTVTDAASGESDTRSVSLTVDPVTDLSATDDAFSTNEDTILNADVSTNDSTTSGGALSYAVATGASNGSVTLNGDGTFTYTPTANYTGSDSFTYTVTDADSGESSTQTVTITVDPVTDLTATDDSFSTNEDTALNADVSTNDSTTSGGTLSYAVATGASNGSVSMNADGTFTYTPTSNYTGSDSFTYTVTDAASGESSTQTVTITVDAVSDLTATDDAFSTNEDTVLNADVSTNDSTTSGGALSYALATGASNGSVSMNADGTFTYTPTTNFNGADSFSYTVTDAASGESDTRTVSLTVNPASDLTATDDSFSTNEDTALNADVSTNDSTTSGGGLSYALATGASNGSVVVNNDGTFTYTPNSNYTGADSFSYTVTDAAGGESDTRSVSLTVDPVTDLSATDDAFSTNEDTVLNADVSTNDSTTSGGALSYTLATGAANGSVVVNNDGTFTYTPGANYVGADSFTYTVTDAASGESDTRTVSLTVNPVADLSATDDSFSTNEDTALNADVSTNDSTTSGGALSYALATGTSNGSVTLNGDGTFTYTPTSNYTGADSFTYTVTDAASGESDTRTVSLTVDPVTDLSATDDAFSTNEDTVLNADVSTNDSTTSGGALSYALAAGATNGSVVVNSDGTFTYTPTANFNGADSFTYTVTDAASGESDTRTVSLTVNPVADLSATDDSFSTNEDTALNADVSTNDSTTSGGALSYALATGTSNGSVTLNGDGTFTYTPTSNYTGADSFTYTVTDAASGESDTRTVSLTVDPVTDLTATDDAFSTNEDTVLNADVSTNDSTTSGGALSYALATGASNGTLALNADGTFTYTPGANYTGADSFTYTVTDAASGESDTRSVSLTVDPVTDLSATDDAFSTNEDTILNADVSTNDSTTSGGALSYAVATGASNGSVTLNGDGTFTYTPTANYTGSDSFTYTVTDADSGESDTRTVSLTVDPVTDLSATDDAFSTNEDTVLNADVSTNDSTTSGGALSYALATGATNGSVVVNNDGAFTYTPGANYTGADSFTYTVTDAASGESDTRTVSLTINPVNDIPNAVNDAYTTNEDTPFTATLGVDDLLQNDSDLDGDTLTVNTTPIVDVSNGTLVLNADGTFTYTPTANFNGSDSFTYEVSDGNGGLAQATVTITVDPVNDNPTAVNDSFTVNEGSTTNLNLAANDTDADDGLDLASITIVSGPTNGSLAVNANGTVDYTHDGSETVSDSFTYTIDDASGTTSNVVTVNLSIDPVNDAPIHSVPGAQSISGNTPLVFSSQNGNSITVADADGSGAPVEVMLSVSNGTLSLAGTSGLSFTAGDGSSDAAMTFTGTAAAINAALNGLSFQADADYEGMAMVQIITDDLGNVGTGGALNAMDRVNITVTAGSPTGIAQDTLLTLDELIIEDMLDLPAPEPVSTLGKRVNVASAAEDATEVSSPAAGSVSTPASNPALDTMPGSGRGAATQADVSLPGLVPLFDQNLQSQDDSRPSSVRLIGNVIRQGLVDPFTYAKMLNPLQPDAAIWESIEAMMEQMDGRDGSWYSDDQVLTTTTATGLTVSFTVGYVSWLLRAGYLSASLLSVLPLWREFDPLPVLATSKEKKRKSGERGKEISNNNDIESENIFTSNETV